MPDSTNTMVDFAGLLLGALGFTDAEFVSLLYEPPQPPHTAVRAPADAIAEIASCPAPPTSTSGSTRPRVRPAPAVAAAQRPT